MRIILASALAAVSIGIQPAAAVRGSDPCPERNNGISRYEWSALLSMGFPMFRSTAEATVPTGATCWLNANWAAYRAHWNPDALFILLYFDGDVVTGYDFYFIVQ